MRLNAPDPLSIILIYLAAIFTALREALAPGTPLAKAAPSLTMAGIWPYVPLVLVSAAAVIWIVRGLTGQKLTAPTPSSGTPRIVLKGRGSASVTGNRYSGSSTFLDADRDGRLDVEDNDIQDR